MTAPNWPRVRLKELGTWFGGGTPSKSNPAFWTDGTVPWLSPKDMGPEVLGGTRDHITDDAVQNSSVKRVPAGSVALVVRSGILERTIPVAVVPFDTTLNQDMKAVVPRPDIDARWIAWGLRASEQELLRTCRKAGTTVASMEMPRLYEHTVPIPPLYEQRRIVDILEDHFSRLAAAVSDCAAAQTRMAQWQRSIMLRAILGGSGDLGEPIRTGVELAGPLAPDISLPLGWYWSKWRDIGSSQNGKLFPSSDYSQEGIRLLRPGNMGADGSLTWTSSATRRLPGSYANSHAAMLLAPNDLVINLTAQSLKDDFLGRVCLVGREDSSLLNQRIARLRTSDLTPGFALIVFRSPLFREHVKALNTGSLIQHMFTKQINEFWLPVPPKDVQVAVAAEVRDKLAVAMRMTDAVDVVKARSLALRRSLLAAAFSGRLTGRTIDVEMVEEMAGV